MILLLHRVSDPKIVHRRDMHYTYIYIKQIKIVIPNKFVVNSKYIFATRLATFCRGAVGYLQSYKFFMMSFIRYF